MDNTELIKKFYTAFANGDSQEMTKYYHQDIVFQDPAFGRLKGERAVKMWKMLLSQKKANLQISFDNIQASAETGSVNWTANYIYGKDKRQVTNHVQAQFKFQDGKIIEHIDTFDLWKWSKQALGLSGYLLGWSSFMKNKIQQTTNSKLDKYMKNN